MVQLSGPAYDPAAWETFAAAEVGAAAALAGLLVVAGSINITRILAMPAIVARLGGTLVLFGAVLVTGVVLLVPGQSARLAGAEIGLVGLAAVGLVAWRSGVRGAEPPYRTNAVVALTMGLIAAALVAIGGVACAIGALGGLYWIVPGTLLVFAVGLGNAWVALVEILR